MDVFDTITQFGRMLHNLDRWLVSAEAYAAQHDFPVDVLAQARLAPSQYELIKQVQSACDAAKYAAAYLAGQTAPSHPDTEQTIAELRARIGKCQGYLEGFKPADFTGAEERRVAPAWMQGKSVRGAAYLTRIGVPNFYFHVTTAYAILRHNGVGLGKADYIGVGNWDEIAAW
ncbi:MAG: DUF1993 domain-containing protein [Deltaproteobacteria bacterium]|nr:DUF1993 domain-containing protein [Deltaproteobacteria bacterium]